MADPGQHRSPIDRLVGPIRDALIESLDVNDIVARVDPDDLISRVDINAVIERVDVNHLLDRVDVDRLLDRVDVDRLIDHVDVDRIISRVDVDRIVRRVQVDRIVASSTGRVAGSMLDVVRRQLVGVDTIVLRTVQRMRGVDPATRPDGPPGLIGDREPSGPYDVTGRYAGPVTRLVANVMDVAAGFGLFTLLSAGLAYLASILFGIDFRPANQSGPAWWVSLVLVLFLYGWLTVAIAGRTPAMGLLGLRVVARDGSPLPTGRAAIRTLVLPVSMLALGLGFLGLFVQRERLGLHDAAAGSAVVYDWGDRPASLPTPLGDWLSRHETTRD